MRLFYSVTSPYARKVLVTAMEKGFCGRLELVSCNPHEAGAEVLAYNPMSRVPTLVLEDGTSLYDSPVICEWLDAVGEGPGLIPTDGAGRWQVLRLQALADGMMDDAYDNVMEGRRPTLQQRPEDLDRRSAALLRSAAALGRDLAAVPLAVTLGHIAAACALGYLDFRLPELGWRCGNPGLADWYAGFSRRPAMAATRPDAGAPDVR
jgi:glutathione S-transferase